MKNFLPILVLVLIVGGVWLALASSGSKKDTSTASTSESTKSATTKKEDSMNQKQYSAFPGVLSKTELVGKKARFETNKGSFTIKLFGEKAPKAVSNFIFLSKEGFYNDLIFHRVIADFMIQGGDPQGNGTGGPGYDFEDEFEGSLTFSKPGILAMANSGPDSNGSQFFITVAPTPHLNNKHTIFGEVIEGYGVIEAISKVSVDDNNQPQETVTINSIEII
jgi:cyclophilin family peptidyl-prolyl cis-trans isomerase